MVHELRPSEYESVRSLFQPLRFHLSSAAVLDGNNPGQVFVDDPDGPQSAFMLSPEGGYLAGDPDNRSFVRALHRAIVVEGVLGEEVHVLSLVVHPARWRGQLSTLLDPHTPSEMRRRHYVCRRVRYDWRARLPDGCMVRRIDRRLLDMDELSVPDHVTGWMVNNWGSAERFLEGGFGFVTLCAGEVASWSLTDCVSGDGCEIGIRTAPAHRRRGLATLTAAAAVEHALAHGFAMVGWHCPEENRGSIGTAEKVGFLRERDYVAYYAMLDEQQSSS